MGGRRARRLCPHAIVVPPRMSAYSEASKAVFARLRRHDARRSRGCRSTRRSSTCAGWSGASARRVEIAARLRAAVREQVGLPITVGVARTKFLAKVASGVAKPDGLLVVPPDGELAFLHPLPVERLWGVGPVDGAASCTSAGSRPSAGRAAAGVRARVDARPGAGPAPARARAQPRPAPRRRRGRRRGSIGSQRALGRAPRSPESGRRRPRRARRSRHAADARGAAASAARSCSACASTTTRARRARTRCRTRPRAPQAILATARALLAAAAADDRAPRPHARRHLGRATSTTPRRCSSCCRSTAATRTRSTRRSTRSATASARRRSRAPSSSAASPGFTMPLLPGLGGVGGRRRRARPLHRYAATATGSGRTITVSAIGKMSVAGMPARSACSRIFSGLDAW